MRATFTCGLLLGIIGIIILEATDCFALFWEGVIRTFFTIVLLIAGFVTIVRASNGNKAVITESLDHFFLGCACGISGTQLLLPGVS